MPLLPQVPTAEQELGSAEASDDDRIPRQIEIVLAARKASLPRVDAAMKSLEAAESAIKDLRALLRGLVGEPDVSPELRAIAERTDFAAMLRSTDESLGKYRRLRARFGRDTVNLGVSGQARVGKSTLLQAISGLGDDALPTGTGTPVTAVRSRITNAPTAQALLRMHDWDSFRDEVLKPYHDALELPGLPATPDLFRTWPYPKPSATDDNTVAVMRRRLLRMQEQLDTFLPFLNGEIRVIDDLRHLRPWVSYPDPAIPDAHMRYLAVKGADIECPFPHTIAGRIGLVDLPGLGEIAARAEERHVDDLREDVDFVLFVKRPVEGMAFWTAADGKARKLIDDARKPISRASDFVGIVSNEGKGVDRTTAERMRGDVREKANEGLGDSRLGLYRCDALDREDVAANLLVPVLARLVDRLPAMDEELTADVEREVDVDVRRLALEVRNLTQDIVASLPEAPGTQERLDHLTDDLHGRLATGLRALITKHRAAARSAEDDLAFNNAVIESHHALARWARGEILGRGREIWLDMAEQRLARDLASAPLATDELNRIRVHIGETYCRLDRHLYARMEGLWESVGDLLVDRCGALLTGAAGKPGLEKLAHCLSTGREACPDLERSIRDLLNIRISYRAHFHARVREALDVLDQTCFDASTGGHVPTVPNREPTRSGAELVLRDLCDLAVQASHEVKQRLLRESGTTAKILHATIEQFDDSFIRSGSSRKELRRFARSWRNELFPQQFDEVEARSSAVSAVRAALTRAEGALSSTGWSGVRR